MEVWRESLSRSLGTLDAAEHRIYHGNTFQEETTHPHSISGMKIGKSFLTHNRVLQQALVRSLGESKAHFVVKDTWSFRPRYSGQQGRSNTL